jgi:regulator of protease activity HflC (stomatin/prohibitin superfamily)
LVGPRGPGLFFIIPIVDRMVKVDLRVVTLDIPAQEAITKDNVTVKVNAVAYFRVMDPSKAIVAVEDYRRATWQIAQTSLRSVLGQSDLDELLIHRDEINQKLQRIIDEQTEPWGIKVSIVEVKDVELPDTLKRAMARQAEAEREKRAKIIHAEGEFVASEQLKNAAEVISREPAAIQLRYLQTLTEIAVEKNSTIIFPVPLEFFKAFAGLMGPKAELPAAEG